MFRYENSLCFAFTAKMLGMRKEVVKKKITDSKNFVLIEGQYGEWLRAVNERMSNKGRVPGKKDLAISTLISQEDVGDERERRVE